MHMTYGLSRAIHVHGLGIHVHCMSHYGNVLSCGLECLLPTLVGV